MKPCYRLNCPTLYNIVKDCWKVKMNVNNAGFKPFRCLMRDEMH